jgi:hypothetical protein
LKVIAQGVTLCQLYDIGRPYSAGSSAFYDGNFNVKMLYIFSHAVISEDKFVRDRHERQTWNDALI